MCNDIGEGSRCCAGYSIVGAIFTVSFDIMFSSNVKKTTSPWTESGESLKSSRRRIAYLNDGVSFNGYSLINIATNYHCGRKRLVICNSPRNCVHEFWLFRERYQEIAVEVNSLLALHVHL